MPQDTHSISSTPSRPQSNDAFGNKIESCTVAANQLKVSWGDGLDSNYVFSWLRDWCTCDACIDRRQIDCAAMLDLPLDCTPRTVEVNDDGAVRVVWEPDGHQSVYLATWLRAHGETPSTASGGHSGTALAKILPEVDYGTLENDEASQLDLFEKVREFGFALVRGVPNDPDEVANLGRYLGYLQGGWRYTAQPEEILVTPVRAPDGAKTNGKDSTVEAMEEANDAHYQRTLLVPHTDFSFTSWPTGLFIFHCLAPSTDRSGETILVDGFHVADRLRREDPEAFELLSTVRQPLCGHGKLKIDWQTDARMISVNHKGEVTGIRFSVSSRRSSGIRNDLIDPYYRASNAMLRLLLDRECQVHLPLVAGDCLVLDNHRILHGRTGMDPVAASTRWFRRFDVERDAAQTRMRQLARRLDREVAPLPSGAHA